jgi:protoheme IX farnesyltransferase
LTVAHLSASRRVSAAADVDVVAAPSLAQRIGVYVELTKPGIVRMVLITAAAGFFMGAGVTLDVLLLLHTLLGMGLVASGACALNEYVERVADARMQRTAQRPIPSGRMAPRVALRFAVALSALGLLHLVVFVGAPTALIVALTLASYIFVYTPLKRRTWVATLVGAVPGALPILAGSVAATGRVTAAGLALFGILFLWQMPHFYSLAWLYRDDYARGGFRMLTVDDPTGARTGRQIVLFGCALFLVSLLPALLGPSGAVYLAAAIVLGGVFVVLGIAMAVRRDDRRAARLFLGSVAYLPLLLLMMVVDRLIG